MTPKLNVEGKVALLEQALRFGDYMQRVFSKILFSRRCFVALASVRSVYHVGISIKSEKLVQVSFRNPTHEYLSNYWLEMSLEIARRLFQLLNPNMVTVLNYDNKEQEFVNFLKDSTYKISIGPLYEVPNLILPIWPRVTRLYASCDVLRGLDNPPMKNFDKLSVWLGPIDQLETLLQYNTKELLIGLNKIFNAEGSLSRISKYTSSGKIKKCTIVPDSFALFPVSISPLVKGLVKALQPNLKRLDLWTRSTTPYRQCETFIDDFKLLIDVAEVINDAGVKSNIDIRVTYEYYQNRSNEWINQLNNNPTFEKFRSKRGNNTFVLEHKIGAVEIKMIPRFIQREY